jgi:hypothetical protein
MFQSSWRNQQYGRQGQFVLLFPKTSYSKCLLYDRSAMVFVAFLFVYLWHPADASVPLASSLVPGFVVTTVLLIGGVYLMLTIYTLYSLFIAKAPHAAVV